jgi:hypothetical protein
MPRSLLVALGIVLAPVDAFAQQPPTPPAASTSDRSLPRVILEGAVGLASFVDDAPIEYGYFGGSDRAYLTPRIAVGPEFIYMNGPDGAHQWHLTGNVSVDLVRDVVLNGRRPRVVPYVIAAGGFQRMTTQVGTGPFTSSEGSVSGGVGARVALGERLFVAPEFRLGWELHYRFGATIGGRF